MSNTHREAGTCYIKVDGVQLEVVGNMEVPLNTSVKEDILSTQGLVGYKETKRAPYYTDPGLWCFGTFVFFL
ncbi:MAG: phage tail tube protein [Succinivibrio dextrinosolvens]|nr:phage tail tube protein [Succinivibrio dextrinosolvens]